MEQSIITAKVNDEDKKQFEDICKQSGLTMSAAIKEYMKIVIQEQKLPFEVKTNRCK